MTKVRVGNSSGVVVGPISGIEDVNAGTNVTIDKTDPKNPIISSTASSGGGGHTIEDEGTPLTQRTKLNFVGDGVTVTDDSGDDATVVTIPAASIDGSGTANEITAWSDSNTIGALPVATYPSLAELANVKGVTSAIQTQINARDNQVIDIYVYTNANEQNHANTPEPILNVSTPEIAYRKYDLTNYNYIRLVTSVFIASSSANNPRLYPQYSLDGGTSWTTIGTGLTTECISLSTTGNGKVTNYITIPAPAKVDVLLRVASDGGDGSADFTILSTSLQIQK